MLKYDLHMHTIYSRDGAIRPEDMIRIARKRGLEGIAVTDHNTIRGGQAAQKLEHRGLDVICGAEINTDRGDVIGLYLTEEIGTTGHVEVIDEIHRQGGVAIIPHPFDSIRSSAFWPTERDAKKPDAIEVLNARCVLRRSNAAANAFADAYGLPKVAGSDAHFGAEIGNAYTLVPEGESLADAVRKKHTTAAGHGSLPLFHVATTALLMERRVVRTGRPGTKR
jgi:predicted metal-dependent phosphoesterase TrpH